MNLDETRAWGAARAEFWRNPPRGTCPECREDGIILHERQELGLPACCAGCYQKTAVRDRVQACDVCGQGPAFRNPAHRRDEFKCLPCHSEDGYTLDDAGMLRKLMGMAGRKHSRGRVDDCIGAGHGTQCKGQTKPRGRLGVMCDFHHDPKKYLENRQA
jgi:hypothetical protein